MSSWFANISVNMKLALGFGLVLVFTAILALTGWTSMSGLINRSNWMSDITSLNSQLTKLRVTRLQYMVADGDEKVAETVQISLDGFKNYQQKLLTSFKSPENVKMLKQLGVVIADYQKSLNNMRGGYKASIVARDELSTNAGKSIDVFELLQAEVKKWTLPMPIGSSNTRSSPMQRKTSGSRVMRCVATPPTLRQKLNRPPLQGWILPSRIWTR